MHSRLEVRAPLLVIVAATAALLFLGGTMTFPTLGLVGASLLAAAVAGSLSDAVVQSVDKIIRAEGSG